MYSVRLAEQAGAATLAALLPQIGAVGKVAVWAPECDRDRDAGSIRSAIGHASHLQLVEAPEPADSDSNAPRIQRCVAWVRRVTTSHPDLKAIIALSHACGIELGDAVEELGLPSRLLIAAFGANPQSILAIRQGKLTAAVVPNLGAVADRALTVGLE